MVGDDAIIRQEEFCKLGGEFVMWFLQPSIGKRGTLHGPIQTADGAQAAEKAR